jgi:hypothetical protein
MDVAKMKTQRLLMVFLLCLVFGNSLVFAKAVTEVAIVNQAQGVRQLGMGEVATGLSDDAVAMYYNPAGIATLRNIEFNAMYHQNIGVNGNHSNPDTNASPFGLTQEQITTADVTGMAMSQLRWLLDCPKGS